MAELHPPTEPHDHGLLDGGQPCLLGVARQPRRKPAVIVHGGPGSSLVGNTGRSFDPDRFRTVLFDQGGCGRSTPHASDPGTDMRVDTTEYLLADMELLRAHLGIERWLPSLTPGTRAARR